MCLNTALSGPYWGGFSPNVSPESCSKDVESLDDSSSGTSLYQCGLSGSPTQADLVECFQKCRLLLQAYLIGCNRQRRRKWTRGPICSSLSLSWAPSWFRALVGMAGWLTTHASTSFSLGQAAARPPTTDPRGGEFPEHSPGSEHPPVGRPSVTTAAAVVLEKNLAVFLVLVLTFGSWLLIISLQDKVTVFPLSGCFMLFTMRFSVQLTIRQGLAACRFTCALLELVYRLETNLAITCRVYFPEAWCTMQKL